ncbi:MAG: ABC transporter ATP-binding protein [Lachnospiraceae bacterium]|nr:ABC transporter ATP-binding protein [Lachnospiraceae bacterium]
MKKLLRYLKAYRKESIIAPLFKMLEASFELFVPLVVANIVDIGIINKDFGYIAKMGGLLILLGIIGLVCSLTAQYFSAKAAVGFGTALRSDLFAHINSLSYEEIDKTGTSTLITRMTNDINQMQSGVNLVLRLFLRSPFIVFGAMVMAFTINVKAALVFVVAIPLLAVVVFGITAASIPLYKKVQKQLDKVLLVTRENLTGVRVIRSVCRQEHEKETFEETNSTLMGLQVFVGRISAFLNPVTYIIVNAALIAIVWIGALQVDNGIITQGAVIALVNYMSQILVELIKLANLIINITKSLACANRINEVFDLEPSVKDMAKDGNTSFQMSSSKNMAAADTDEAVAFHQVSFAYGGSKEYSLENIEFSVKKGETIGIIGGTGSGKSTLVNLLPRFYDVQTGKVLINGRNVKEFSLTDLRQKFGIVPQRAVLFKGTIRENIRFGKEDATDEEIMKALETAQALDFVQKKKDGLDSFVEQGGSNLSGGQKQRLTIARALVANPEFLILDDSASALDFATDAALRKAIRQNTENCTVFLVSQRATTIKDADKILVLDDGQLAGCGTHKELLSSCDVYREICLSQLSKEEVETA